MKQKILLLASICLLSTAFVNAQVKGKSVVFVDYFKAPQNVDNSLVEVLRSKMIEGIQEMQRLQVVDVSLQEELKAGTDIENGTTRISKMRELGADYIIVGEVVSMSASRHTDSDNKLYYKGKIQWKVNVINAETGVLKTTKTFDHSGLTGNRGNNPKAAIANTCDYAKVSMDDFINETFPLEGTILQVESVKKDKAQTVYIDMGSLQGIMENQRFDAYVETDIAGEKGRTEVGALIAKTVLSEQRTLCKVTKGGKEINDAMSGNKKLVIVTKKAALLDSFKGLF